MRNGSVQATFDEILTDGLCLLGRSRVRPSGSTGPSQSLAQRYLPLVVSTEEHQPSLQVQGKIIQFCSFNASQSQSSHLQEERYSVDLTVHLPDFMESLHQGLAVVRTKDFPKLHQLHQMLAIKEAGGSNFPSIYGAEKEVQRNRANGKTSNAVEGEGQREAQDTDNEDSGEKNNQENLEQEEEEDRGFFRKWYRSDCKQFEQPPLPAQRLSHSVPPLYKTVQKLRCLDIFAGCGGLSLGLDQSGVANTNWTIEKKSSSLRTAMISSELPSLEWPRTARARGFL